MHTLNPQQRDAHTQSTTKRCTHSIHNKEMHTLNPQQRDAYTQSTTNRYTHSIHNKEMHTLNSQQTDTHTQSTTKRCTHSIHNKEMHTLNSQQTDTHTQSTTKRCTHSIHNKEIHTLNPQQEIHTLNPQQEIHTLNPQQEIHTLDPQQRKSADLQVVKLVISHPVKRFLGLHNPGVWWLDVAQGGHHHRAVVRGDHILTLTWAYVAMAFLHLNGSKPQKACTSFILYCHDQSWTEYLRETKGSVIPC